MKEASGEANMTVITIVLIGLVAAAGAVLIPNLLSGGTKKGCCASYGGTWVDGSCQRVSQNGTKTAIPEANYYDATNKTCK